MIIKPSISLTKEQSQAEQSFSSPDFGRIHQAKQDIISQFARSGRKKRIVKIRIK